jgi:hypothetical protein
MRTYGKVLFAVVAVLVGMFMTASARADIIPSLTSVTLLTSGPDTGDYNWTYDVVVTSTEEVVANAAAPTPTSGNYLTMYDIAGLVSGSESMPTGWTASEQTTGVTPNTETPTDTGLLNITFNYSTGATIVGAADLGAFDFVSTLGTPIAASNFYAGQATDTSGAENGTQDQNDGHVPAPTTAVPLPAGSMIGAALCGLVLVGRKYFKTSAV